MTSRAKIAANRSNGRKSHGPRTAAGKSRASINALRHGLSAITHRNALSPKIERIAKALCEDDLDPQLLQQALIIAENELMLRRVRAARAAAIENKEGEIYSDAADWNSAQEELVGEAMPDLDRLERFERRAWLHRKRAMRNFMEIKSKRRYH